MRLISVMWFTHRRTFLLLVALVIGVAIGGCVQRGVSSRSPAAEQTRPKGIAHASPITVNVGKDLFLARRGSCHDEAGDKPLRSGPPLNQRKLSREVIAEAVQGRLKDRTEEEREAVINYIADFQAAFKPSAP